MTISTALSPVATVTALSAASTDDLVSSSPAPSSPVATIVSAATAAGPSLPASASMSSLVSESAAPAATQSVFHAPAAYHVARLANETQIGMHYPPIRTANSFTLPYTRILEHSHQNQYQHQSLLEDKHESAASALLHHTAAKICGETLDEPYAVEEAEKEAAAYEALVRLGTRNRGCLPNIKLLLPPSLRSMPYWSRASGPRRCIVYLEPRRKTPLYMAIEEFFRVSAEIFGHTEAHQYHPHSSMTGFIDISDGVLGPGQSSGQALVRIATYLQSLIVRERATKAFRLPHVHSVNTAYDYPHKGTHKIEVKLDTPELFRTIVSGLVDYVPQAKIRSKHIGHISLAYYNKYVKTENCVTVEQAKRLDRLARSIIYSQNDSDTLHPENNLWDVAFYELAFKSTVLSAPHRFNQIARWQL
ncbi:hypothetical protein J3B02_000102 [Coemansia erecta]|uniref:Uncharacterized protein n=1 Tax=Coemansia asiatica TaxID=1052880 RepID=A0A9W7XQ46_9FUNG|nr:hypothetical protein LPJ64_000890 [Coemansia asiatica]KAJ2858721.1 hypothetical protein J3B02_000102 [Coemansia erecta]KAJ2879082.1 hypothetical protein FB639_003185 [Coemansia asiatica]